MACFLKDMLMVLQSIARHRDVRERKDAGGGKNDNFPVSLSGYIS